MEENIVKCPICNKEMEEGYIQGARGVLFSPDIKQFLISKSPFSEKDIKITNSIFSCHSPAYYCYDCDCLVWKKGESSAD